MKELAEAFEEANPGVTVEYAAQSNASDAAMKLTNAIAAGKGAPDVCMLEDAHGQPVRGPGGHHRA